MASHPVSHSASAVRKANRGGTTTIGDSGHSNRCISACFAAYPSQITLVDPFYTE